jgi:glycosyltransferase domain-containing protein
MHLDIDNPLVSIGIPTYNRSQSLVRAVESALAQDYDNLEIVISDNASADETETVCVELCNTETRIRYIRQPKNLGMTENFRQALAASHGAYFMWLSDDDWLDPSYISQCVHFLTNNRDYVLVCGTEKYHSREAFLYEGTKIDLTEDSRIARVLSYYQKVSINGVFYGVARSDLLAGLELQHVLGGDWLFSAAVAYLGKVKMLETTSIHRSIAGESQDLGKLGLAMGMSTFQARNAHLAIALAVLSDIGWRSPTYRSSGKLTRLFLGLKAASAIILRFYLPLRLAPLSRRLAPLARRLAPAKRRVRAHSRRLHRLLDRHLLWRFQGRADEHKDR